MKKNGHKKSCETVPLRTRGQKQEILKLTEVTINCEIHHMTLGTSERPETENTGTRESRGR